MCFEDIPDLSDLLGLSDRSANIKKMKNSKASKDVRWDKGHKKVRKGSKFHKAGGTGGRHPGKHARPGHGMGHAAGPGILGGMFGGNAPANAGSNPGDAMQPNANGTVIDIGMDDNGNFIPLGIQGPNVGGVVVKDPQGNTVPWKEYKQPTTPSGQGNKPVDSGYQNGIYDMTGNDNSNLPPVSYESAGAGAEEEDDEGMDEYGKLIKKRKHPV